MYPLKSAIRAQASRSTIQRASHASTSTLLSTASSRRTAYSLKPTALQLSRGIHASLGVSDKKWINQKGNEKATAVADHDKGKDKSKTGEDIAAPVSAAENANVKSKIDPTEKPLPEVVPEENGIADEGESPSKPSVEKTPNKESTTSKPSSGKESSASSTSSTSTPPSSSGNGDGSSSKPTNAITKLSIPEIYPQVLALPITRRPLFPG